MAVMSTSIVRPRLHLSARRHGGGLGLLLSASPPVSAWQPSRAGGWGRRWGAGGGGSQTRQLHSEALLLPPLVFCGLLAALWTWKCTMMVLFQNKIIYMPGMPPNTRRERIDSYASQCGGVRWREERTRAADGTDLALCVASVLSTGRHLSTSPRAQATVPLHAQQIRQCDTVANVYVLYFQGNASSLPPRLPDLSWVLRQLQESGQQAARYTMVCLSYRGYWTSRGRPSERGLNQDAEAALEWIYKTNEEVEPDQSAVRGRPAVIVFWGQSIGAGIATNLAARIACKLTEGLGDMQLPLPNALVLETPFLSVRAMLEHLYPQRWLPYRYLWPFLRNHLDNWGNMASIAGRYRDAGRDLPRVLILEAGRDELVPPEHGAKLFRRCEELGIPVRRFAVANAYHSEAVVRGAGKKAVYEAIEAEARRLVVSQSVEGG